MRRPLQTIKRQVFKPLAVSAFALTALLSPLMAKPVFAQSGGHLITMQDADIKAFIEDTSSITGKSFIVDPRVQGKVNIASEQRLSKNEVFQVFKEVMRVNNYTVIPTNSGEYRITLTQNAAQEAPLAFKNGVSGQLSTVILSLQNEDAAEAAKLIRPVVHAQGRLAANPGGRVVIITDFPENIAKARAIIAAIDQDKQQFETVQLSHLSALEAESALRTLQGARPDISIVAVPATNSIIMQGSRASLDKLRPVLSALDRPRSQQRSNVSIIPLRFADGENILNVLTTLLPGYTVEGAPAPSVALEVGSNSIIINALPEVQDAMAGIIRQLDERRPQVLVEALIVEISDRAARDLGVQLGVAGTNGSNIPLLTTNFSRNAPNLLALTGALAGPGLGLTDGIQGGLEDAAVSSLLGINGPTAGFASQGNDAIFSAIITAVETDTDSNILSTPFVTTLDNVPASLLVGQEIPITTGETLGATNINPFRSFERKDVGIKLDITPQISDDDTIRLEIKQEVSTIAGALSQASTLDPITNQRNIETTVLADDGEIIVLGGLLQDDDQISAEKVPLLGDVPVLGNLFRSRSRTRTKTNLMVFLRPTIIRSADDARPLTEYYLEQGRKLDLEQSGRDISKIDSILPKR